MKTAIIISSIVVVSAIAADAPIPTADTVAKTYAKTLTRLTDKPKSVGAEFATMCSSVPSDLKNGPHNRHYVHHYRNDLAKAAQGNFPAGSVLVKEKLMSVGEEKKLEVVSVTGMIKQPTGTSPTTGDWLFFTEMEGKVETAKMEGCAGCHTGAKRDYVFTDLRKR